MDSRNVLLETAWDDIIAAPHGFMSDWDANALSRSAGGKTGTKSATSSARRGVLPMRTMWARNYSVMGSPTKNWSKLLTHRSFAAPPAGVRAGVKAFALTTETLPLPRRGAS